MLTFVSVFLRPVYYWERKGSAEWVSVVAFTFNLLLLILIPNVKSCKFMLAGFGAVFAMLCLIVWGNLGHNKLWLSHYFHSQGQNSEISKQRGSFILSE